MKQAAVLGAAGFVGRHTARALARAGYDVVGIGHGSWLRDEWREWGLREWHVADIGMEALMTYAGDPEILVQCAGSGSVAFSMTHPAQDFRRSVDSTLAALDFVRLQAPECHFVLPSSAAVYGTVDRMPIAVDDPLRPESPYGVHKTIAEDLCRSYARTFGVRAAIVRLFSVYGVGLRKQLLWDSCTKLTQGEARFAGTGEELRDWLDVEDAAALLLRAAERASPDCPIVNGGTGRAANVRTIVEGLARELCVDTSPVFSGQRRSGDPIGYEADIAGALGWGWRPERSLADGLASYAAWFRDEAR
ncbi:SDR family oxidoreductase [Sphingomonas sp. QA11]|uniref:NAD-dependent epimerase/dehydratase family protein n=1 Tax=Sphingomonas sp. QA11 TaxID=2950605 RepID=UPI00234A7518|nr:SDR family oxidoreductase [Sphingomonas sp. QA11]WCM29690.1 SDR family oxidoreductase [Sphingomonas sp. QA11]